MSSGLTHPQPELTAGGRNPSLRRENNFDALRLIAAICVVVEHATVHLDSRFFWYTPTNGLWFFDGVSVFFILSGGMVYASAEKCQREGRPVRLYLLNRLLRIAPAIYAYLAAMIVLLLALQVITMQSLFDAHFAAWAASNLFLTPVYHPVILQAFGIGVVNGSLWTIPAEVGFYLIVPFLVWLAARYGFWKMILTAMAVGLGGLLAYAAFAGHDTDRIAVKMLGVTFLPWLGYFVIGIAIARLWPRLPQHWLLGVAAGCAYLLTWACRRSVDNTTAAVFALAGAVPLAYVAFWLGHKGPALLRRITARLGDLSFGTYIWHMPIVNVAIWAGARDLPVDDTVLVGMTVIASMALGFASWHLVEKPALRLKRYSSRAE